MEIKDRIALVQSSAECSTGIVEGATFLSNKMRGSSKAVSVVLCYHAMVKVLVQRVAVIKHRSQASVPKFTSPD